jgi:Tubulin-tyrosine ligase family
MCGDCAADGVHACAGRSPAGVWAAIKAIVVRSIIAVQPVLAHEYAYALPPCGDPFRCFEVLGYDFLLDAKGRPWLLEVNHSPSFHTDSALDVAVKDALIRDTLRLVRPEPAAAKNFRKVRSAPCCTCHAPCTQSCMLRWLLIQHIRGPGCCSPQLNAWRTAAHAARVAAACMHRDGANGRCGCRSSAMRRCSG